MSAFVYMASAIAVWNIIVFFMFGIDKRKALKNRWRISEKMLLTCAFAMGGIGSGLGMYIFRHKTKHMKFIIGVPASIIFNALIFLGFIYFFRIAG